MDPKAMDPVIAMDAALTGEEQLELPTPKPFYHFVAPIPDKPFTIVSEERGPLKCYFRSREAAQPFLRMLVRGALRGRGRLDFRLYQWKPEMKAWTIAQRTMPAFVFTDERQGLEDRIVHLRQAIEASADHVAALRARGGDYEDAIKRHEGDIQRTEAQLHDAQLEYALLTNENPEAA